MGRRLNTGLIEQILQLLGEKPMSSVELSPLVGRSANHVGCVLAWARERRLVVRLCLAPRTSGRGGRPPWVYGVSNEAVRLPWRQPHRGAAANSVRGKHVPAPSRGKEHIAPWCTVGRGYRWGLDSWI